MSKCPLDLPLAPPLPGQQVPRGPSVLDSDTRGPLHTVAGSSFFSRTHRDHAASAAPPALGAPRPPRSPPLRPNPHRSPPKKEQKTAPTPKPAIAKNDFKIFPDGLTEGTSVWGDIVKAKATYERSNPKLCFWSVHGKAGCRISQVDKCKRCKAAPAASPALRARKRCKAAPAAPPAPEAPRPRGPPLRPPPKKKPKTAPTPTPALAENDFKTFPTDLTVGKSVWFDVRKAKANYELSNPTLCFWKVHGLQGCLSSQFDKCERCKAS